MHHPNYSTPIKPTPSYHRHLFNSDSIHRQGDWVCVNCQNLNYSFRKKCNRCKTQSREENDKQHSVYSYYYYGRLDMLEDGREDREHQKYFGGENSQLGERKSSIGEENFQNIQFGPNHLQQNETQDWNTVLETPKKKKPLLDSTSKLDGLPSVSPLVKKYHKKQHHTTLQKLNTSVFSPSDQKDFEQIKIRDFDKLIQDLTYTRGTKNDLDTSPFKEIIDDDDVQGVNFMKEIEESISRIII